jgi:predicted permease
MGRSRVRRHIVRPPRKVVRLVVATVCLVMLGLLTGLVYRVYQPEPGLDESGVVTVVSVVGGNSGKFGGSFAHHVRLDSGSEGTMTFREVFPRGARVWVSYRRYPRDGRLQVKTYMRRSDPP